MLFAVHIFGATMKNCIRLSAAVVLLCSFVIPIDSFASTTRAKARPKAIAACEGKKVGDTVAFINKWNKRVIGICREENGQLIAVPAGK